METQDRGRDAATLDTQFVVFVLDEQRYAIPLRQVERIVRAVEVRPLPEAPPYLQGVVNVQGRALPVVDLRKRFGLPERPIDLGDHFVIADGSSLSMILPVDDALGSRELGSLGHERVEQLGSNGAGGSRAGAADVMMLAPECVRHVVPDEQGLVFVLDLDHVMSLDAAGVDPSPGLKPVELW